jgi:predicted anti-sigma-YlaC factor YlaD
MGFQWRRATPCERAARSISLRLDGELSELEGAALDRHLAQCAGCRTLSVETVAFTQFLREAPLVEVGRRIVVTHPGRARARLVRRAAAAVALAGAVTAASVVGVLHRSADSDPAAALAFRSVKEQRQFVRAELIRLEPNSAFVVETPPRLVGRGLL